ncbi:neutral/alkaline non-lysosomal ceramidase N-terminal domain-containing protein [Nannocystis sp. SCPEA4]|uniref:neutral/alkaline non-lysosomal ceramidase N-terminal domain-containing protein n=1 Tax=Nannocystis sp. SCPEA4 TaxID=2996787 RepID=UPI002271FBD3|nr:neutral/alkaline non-lysosomal ceramidase N-terminal domain-containing protein [Nannocystis sp. SCPEA4]MCY1061931.1 neutral/alkaline non-lysosomal ceramidase N-terminal domain-containing protein [Nannocystis sp. SCPEA4]
MRPVLALPALLALAACGDDTGNSTGASATDSTASTASTEPTTGATVSSDSMSDTAGPPTTSAGSEGDSDSASTTATASTTAPTSGDTTTGGELTCDQNPHYRVGTAIRDITGPSAELVMMGYSMPEQKAEGISTRLWARAFVVEHPCSGSRIAFVSADLGQVFQGVHLEVVKRLKEKFGADRYDFDNIALSATHTHSGLGGFSHYTMFNLAVGGYDPDNFEVIVAGIVDAIVAADAGLDHGVVKIAQGPLQDANWNRSPQAYAENPDPERAAHEAEMMRDTNTDMTVLRFERTGEGELDGEPIGMLTWFSSHATSVSNQNRLVSGDHKGLASYFTERHFGADYTAPNPFVAAYAQSDAGDVSPSEVIVGEPKNTVVRPCDDSPDPLCDDLGNAVVHGTWQHERALELFDEASEHLRGPAAGRLAFVDMENVTVGPEFTGEDEHTTCHAAIGFSIAAGAEDGVAVAFIEEGIVYGDLPMVTLVPEDQACHEEKTILLPVGRMLPYPWSPTILPAQVLRLGGLAIVPVPFEITTISGRRLRASVLAQLEAAGVTRAVIAGLSNGYSSYVSTREEYAIQHYEGAFTQFGPWTLAAWQQEFSAVAEALRDGVQAPHKAMPLDLSDDQIINVPGVVADSPCALLDAALCPFDKFGDVVVAPPASAAPGDLVKVTFRGAHPRNNLRTGTGYLEVQRDDGGEFTVVARDWDPETRFRWRRTGGPLSPTSEVDVEWRIPADVVPGTYRVVYFGDAKSLLGNFTPISGTSPTFTVQ